MVSNEIRVKIVDKYAQKLINSEYSLDHTREFIVGGLKGYERLLSLSKDLNNPKWKPLHMAASWNSRNRRIAKQRSKTNWYKGKEEVEPPTTSSTGGGGDHPSQKADKVPRKTTPEKSSLKAGKGRKKRGEKRDNITLGGLRKVEKTAKRKEKQRINKKLGDLQFQTMKKQQERRKRGPPPPTRSVMFIDNTARGILVKRMQNVEIYLG